MNKAEEALLVKVLDLFAEEFGKYAILRGGMALKVIGSARFTKDLDYVFIPYKSKKDIVAQILNCLSSIQGAKTEHSLNSKCLRIILSIKNTSIQIEATVSEKEKSMVVSTNTLAEKFGLQKKLIYILDPSVAMAHKIAAWNERRLIRDLYDIYFFLQMNILPDKPTLEKRLKKPTYSKLIKKEAYYKGVNLPDFYIFLREEVALLSEKQIKAELSDYLLPEEIVGLSSFFRAAFIKLK